MERKPFKLAARRLNFMAHNKSPDYTEANPNNPRYVDHKPALASVATSGSYTDLSSKPTIPSAQIQSDYAQTNNAQIDFIKNKDDTKTWAGTTTTGVCTIYLTQNGLSAGLAYYVSVKGIVVAFTGNDTNLGKSYTISGDLKTLTITATQQSFSSGNALLNLLGGLVSVLTGVTVAAVPNGTQLTAIVTGKLA